MQTVCNKPTPKQNLKVKSHANIAGYESTDAVARYQARQVDVFHAVTVIPCASIGGNPFFDITWLASEVNKPPNATTSRPSNLLAPNQISTNMHMHSTVWPCKPSNWLLLLLSVLTSYFSQKYEQHFLDNGQLVLNDKSISPLLRHPLQSGACCPLLNSPPVFNAPCVKIKTALYAFYQVFGTRPDSGLIAEFHNIACVHNLL